MKLILMLWWNWTVVLVILIFHWCNKRCECCNYYLINDHYTFKNVQITFTLKHHFTCDSFNLIYVVNCGRCKKEYIERQEKTKLSEQRKTEPRDRDRVYCQQIRQPQYQQLKLEGSLAACDNGEFQIFSSLQMHSQKQI